MRQDVWPTGRRCKWLAERAARPGAANPRIDRTPTGLTAREPLARRRRGYIFNAAGDYALVWLFSFVRAVGDFFMYDSAVFYTFACYLICCVFLGPLSSKVRVSVGLWLVFLPRSAGIAPPQSRLFHLGVSVPRAHGSITVCGVALQEIKEAMRPWLGITFLHFLPTVSGWITQDTTVMVTLGHIRLRSCYTVHAPSLWKSSGLCSYGAVLGVRLNLMTAYLTFLRGLFATPHSFSLRARRTLTCPQRWTFTVSPSRLLKRLSTRRAHSGRYRYYYV